MSNRAALVGELIEAFAALREPDAGAGVTRLAFTPLERRAHELFACTMTDLGLTVHTDPGGNTIAELAGEQAGLPALGTGSHLDSVPNAGAFDGIVGVVGAMIAAKELVSSGRLRHPTRFVVFAGEEGARFGQACSGSRMAAGMLERRRLDELVDAEGITLAEAMRSLDLDPDNVEAAGWNPRDWAAFVELHIEQGSVLTTADLPIGLVDTISGSTRLEIVLTGRASHTGGTPMHLRADALTGAAEIVLAGESLASDPYHRGTRVTVGRLDVEPASITTIPGRCLLQLDVRDVDDERQRGVAVELAAIAERIATRRRLGVEVRVLGDVSPAILPLWIRQASGRSAQDLRLPYRVLPSGASHDAQVIANVCPAGMIFVPSRNHGVSHSPDENSSYLDIARGIDLLVATLRRLDDMLSQEGKPDDV